MQSALSFDAMMYNDWCQEWIDYELGPDNWKEIIFSGVTQRKLSLQGHEIRGEKILSLLADVLRL
jgi:hypothetical protein